MNKEEIREYLKRVEELENKLTGEDKDTYQWLIFGYNQCAKLLNETEQQIDQLTNNWNELEKYMKTEWNNKNYGAEYKIALSKVYNKLQELKESK